MTPPWIVFADDAASKLPLAEIAVVMGAVGLVLAATACILCVLILLKT